MSWGYKLMITFIVFATMMGYMVYRCYGTRFELVEKEYYKSELQYQQVINGSRQAALLSKPVMLQQQGRQLVLQMPDEMKKAVLSGTVFFYCPSESRKDRKLALQVDENGQQAFSTISAANYIVKITWQKDSTYFYSEQAIAVLP